MTRAKAKADLFVQANNVSPVVSGAAVQPDPRKPARGCRYELKNGLRFHVGVRAHRVLPEGYPRWDLPS